MPFCAIPLGCPSERRIAHTFRWQCQCHQLMGQALGRQAGGNSLRNCDPAGEVEKPKASNIANKIAVQTKCISIGNANPGIENSFNLTFLLCFLSFWGTLWVEGESGVYRFR
eukprot:1490416-Amphidinium_carterae.1